RSVGLGRQRIGRRVRVDVQSKEALGTVNIADTANGFLVHQDGRDTPTRLCCDVVESLRVSVVAQRIRPNRGNNLFGFGNGQGPTHGRTDQIGPRVVTNDPHPGGGTRFRQLDSDVTVGVTLHNFTWRTNGGYLLNYKRPGPLHAQVHIQYQVVFEIQEPVLPIGLGGDGSVAVQQCCAVGKSALW